MISRTVQWKKDVADLREAVDRLQKQIDQMSSCMLFSNAPRDNWIRKSAPDWAVPAPIGPVWELETMRLPRARRSSDHLALVKPPTAIKRVTICMSGSKQIVTSYDKNGQVLNELSGPFELVGMEVLDQFGENDWEMVRESVTVSA